MNKTTAKNLQSIFEVATRNMQLVKLHKDAGSEQLATCYSNQLEGCLECIQAITGMGYLDAYDLLLDWQDEHYVQPNLA